MQNYFDEKEPELMSEDAAAVWSQIQKAMKQRQYCRNVYKKRSGNYESQCEEETRNQEETSSSLDSLSKEEKKKKEEEKKAHERAFEEAFCRHYPRLSKLDYPLTFDEYCKLLRKYPYQLILSIIQQMEAYKKCANNTLVKILRQTKSNEIMPLNPAASPSGTSDTLPEFAKPFLRLRTRFQNLRNHSSDLGRASRICETIPQTSDALPEFAKPFLRPRTRFQNLRNHSSDFGRASRICETIL